MCDFGTVDVMISRHRLNSDNWAPSSSCQLVEPICRFPILLCSPRIRDVAGNDDAVRTLFGKASYHHAHIVHKSCLHVIMDYKGAAFFLAEMDI
ncbi:hypothetical protein WS87_13740 [Burkholderia sp. MSMB0856]|nr:hypothetical protein WS87_13740 [Burkholderia sp. MSMB0856]KVH30127.1 hypothetical protein WS87_26755 [Burkholderia sp. MSMB0856]